MLLKWVPYGFLSLWLSLGHAVINDTSAPKQTTRGVSSTDVAAWGVSLVVVLGVFFLCVWGLRKLGGANLYGSGKMRMVGGLSLGLRERVILLQVGKKQIVLGVTPGRIETLLVLEGEDCLQQEVSSPATAEPGFAQKLAQALTARAENNRSAHPDR